MSTQERVSLVVTAYIDVDSPDKTTWMAQGADPLTKGLFATGESFHGARRAFADIVAAAVASGSIDSEGVEFDAIRVMSLTRKTFALDILDTSDGTT